MRSIRILHIIDHLGAGGAQEIIKNIIQYSSKERFEYTVFSFFARSEFQNEFESLNIKVINFNLGKYSIPTALIHLLNPKNYLRLIRFLKKESFDILHIHLFFSYVIILFLYHFRTLFKLPNTKIIYTMHALRNQVPYFFPFLKIFSKVPNIIALDMAESLNEMKKNNIQANAVIIIPESTNFFEFPLSNTDQLREELGLTKDHRVLVSIGRLHKQKGHIYAIRALSNIIDQIPQTRYIIIGNGEEMNTLKNETKKLHLESFVFFLGFRRDIIRFYDLCDLFIHPAIKEALGLVILNAMARKKVTIAFDVGVLNMVIKNYKTGFLIQKKDTQALAEKIIFMLQNIALRKRMGKKSQKLVQSHYSLQDFVIEYNKLYEQLYENPILPTCH